MLPSPLPASSSSSAKPTAIGDCARLELRLELRLERGEVVRDDERLERGDCEAERSRERSRERGADELVLELSRESDEISPTSAAVVAQQTARLLRARVPGSSGSCPVAMGGLACEVRRRTGVVRRGGAEGSG